MRVPKRIMVASKPPEGRSQEGAEEVVGAHSDRVLPALIVARTSTNVARFVTTGQR